MPRCAPELWDLSLSVYWTNSQTTADDELAGIAGVVARSVRPEPFPAVADWPGCRPVWRLWADRAAARAARTRTPSLPPLSPPSPADMCVARERLSGSLDLRSAARAAQHGLSA